jgi:hypothetical protein
MVTGSGPLALDRSVLPALRRRLAPRGAADPEREPSAAD